MTTSRMDTDLQGCSKHLYYEVAMFEACSAWLAENRSAEKQVTYAVLESFLIHARVIWDFVCFIRRDVASQRPKTSHKDDIIAEDFFDQAGDWHPKPNPYLDKQCEAINKSLAHLTEVRLGLRQWDYQRIYAELMPYIREFVAAAPSNRLDPCFSQLQTRDVQIKILATTLISTSADTFVDAAPVYLPPSPTREQT